MPTNSARIIRININDAALCNGPVGGAAGKKKKDFADVMHKRI